ncbi:hypothetical protein KY290_009990 [Solanum tuberosum]|uniref:Uncharacterized protein n=1 Tax=Solanum tuberosum TaxID=4113 RepID=A0ABQ7VWJ4_SOLTU|nr:hypothetical protein KY289_010376 [Solanum tuberosum]KAH0708517.1 hypothetical protein KY284_009944 [Solanum tuberosum]KAH0772853.1 hypothetical protein KY290_009990 [Solanum tuberosum]
MLDNNSSSSSRPTIAFPLDDQSSSDDDSIVSANPKSIQVKEHKNCSESLTILMPGDDVPKFLALPTPCCSTLPIETLV